VFGAFFLNFAGATWPRQKANFSLVQRPGSGSIRHMFPEGFQTQRLLLRPIGLADARAIFDSYTQDPEDRVS
jgi:hypothetical protein